MLLHHLENRQLLAASVENDKHNELILLDCLTWFSDQTGLGDFYHTVEAGLTSASGEWDIGWKNGVATVSALAIAGVMAKVGIKGGLKYPKTATALVVGADLIKAGYDYHKGDTELAMRDVAIAVLSAYPLWSKIGLGAVGAVGMMTSILPVASLGYEWVYDKAGSVYDKGMLELKNSFYLSKNNFHKPLDWATWFLDQTGLDDFYHKVESNLKDASGEWDIGWKNGVATVAVLATTVVAAQVSIKGVSTYPKLATTLVVGADLIKAGYDYHKGDTKLAMRDVTIAVLSAYPLWSKIGLGAVGAVGMMTSILPVVSSVHYNFWYDTAASTYDKCILELKNSSYLSENNFSDFLNIKIVNPLDTKQLTACYDKVEAGLKDESGEWAIGWKNGVATVASLVAIGLGSYVGVKGVSTYPKTAAALVVGADLIKAGYDYYKGDTELAIKEGIIAVLSAYPLWSKIGLGAVGVVGMMTSAVHLSLAAYEKMSAEQPINPNGLIKANDNHTYSVVKQVDNGLTFYACRNESDRFKPVINCATGGTNSPWNTNQPASLFTGDLITSDHVGNATVVVS